MNTTLQEKIKSLSPQRQAKIKRLTEELITEKLTLQELRKQRQLTQAQVSEFLGIK